MKRLSLFAMILTTACGGVSTNGPDFEPAPPPLRTFATVEANRQALLRETQTIPLSRAADLPYNSRLNYDGIIATDLRPGESVIGDLDLTVDLAGRGSVTGAAGNFIDRNNRAYRGALEVFGGTFDATPAPGAYQSSAGLRGNLTAPDRRNLSVSGRLDGDVLGRFAEAYEGVVTGEVKYDGGRNQIKGGAVATRQ